MSEGKAKTWAEVFQEAAVVLIFVFGFVVVPEDGYGLIEKVRVGLNESVSPQYLKEHDPNIGIVVNDVLVHLPERHADAFEVEHDDRDRHH